MAEEGDDGDQFRAMGTPRQGQPYGHHYLLWGEATLFGQLLYKFIILFNKTFFLPFKCLKYLSKDGPGFVAGQGRYLAFVQDGFLEEPFRLFYYLGQVGKARSDCFYQSLQLCSIYFLGLLRQEGDN